MATFRKTMGSMGSIHSRAVGVLAGILVGVALLAPSASTATPKRKHAACTAGASSIRAHRVNGRIVVAKPAASGCIPA